MIGIYKDFYTSGEIEVALTRIDHLSATGGGAIGEIVLTIKMMSCLNLLLCV
jgi:hypothetical protein